MKPGRRRARLNRDYFNHFTRWAAGWLPAMGVVEHTGRKSGRVYRTPVALFRQSGGFAIAVIYGTESDWFKNVLAAERAVIVSGGKRYQVESPKLVHDQSLAPAPLWVRPLLRWWKTKDFLLLKA